MGKGFGRGAKSVAVVTHAQATKGGKKLPRGLRPNKKRQKRMREAQAKEDDPNQMLNTKVAPEKPGQKPNSTLKRLDAQIAAVHFQESIPGRGGGLKNLRKQIVDSVKTLRRKHHKKQEKANMRQRERDSIDVEAAMEERNARRGPKQARRRHATPADQEDDSDE
jgi:hypothetical protein